MIESNFKKFIPNKQSMFDFLVKGLRDHTNQTFFHGVDQIEAGYYGSVSLPSFKMIYKHWFSWKNKNIDCL